ncbi:MAG: hypothetical protein WCH39_28195 [Schlesneria sp.]
MTPQTALRNVLLWGVIFACVGAAIGAAIGTVAPGYYQSIFRNGHSPEFNPLQVGIGLGATQGVASGVAISITVLTLLTWRDTRSARPDADNDAPIKNLRSRTWSVHMLWVMATAMSVLTISAATFVLGGIIGQQQLYQTWTERKLHSLTTILESIEFDGVKSEFSSAAKVYLTGTIKDDTSRDALRDKLVFTFGAEEADEMIRRVEVAR